MNDDKILLRLIRQYSKDEAVAAITAELKKVQFDNGVLKSDLSELHDKIAKLEQVNKSNLGNIKKLSTDLKADEQHQKIKDQKQQIKKLNDRIVELSVKNYNLEKLQFCKVLPSKDAAVDKGYSISNAGEYDRRMVIRDADNDLHYTGWLNCYDWIRNTYK